MFTGFASENTPAIQVWDFFRTFASTFAVRSVSLPDDCAPIQVFRTGATNSSFIRVYLPTAPIEGKQITIVNQYYGQNPQKIQIYSSDVNDGGTTSALLTLGSADSITLVYSKQNISYGTNSGVLSSGWILLNKASPTAANYYSAVVGGDNNSAQSTYSFIGGGFNNTTSSSSSVVVGGTSNTASGSTAAVVGGTSNTASSTSSAVVGGSSNVASGQNAGVFGGNNSSVSQLNAAALGGNSHQVTNLNAIVCGGTANIANGSGSIILAGSYGWARGIGGNTVSPASEGPIEANFGRTQTAVLALGRQTTDATATRLTSNSSAASTTNQVILPNNSAYTFQGTCIAARTAAGDTSSWKFEGAIKRGANAASTTLVAAVTPTVIAQDAGASTWVLAITADTTNGGIAVTVTGAAATTIRWVAKIETTEVTF